MAKQDRADQRMLIAADSGVVARVGNEEQETIQIHENVTRVSADHWAVEQAPHLWKPLSVTYPSDEQMTAAPGEKRG